MNAHLYRRVEIAFWDFTIETMTQNQRVRRSIQQIARAIRNSGIKDLLPYLTISAVAGLVCGSALFMVFSLVW